ncbi:wings apart-like protein homolog isoform X2 [Ostrea edulis]|uniref:wings apart-like protein homolog isoform X2 n=1 Tax=Ostrea edulis TaxID=37623 RepID=UPI0024AFE292|nr:wings apart-like protein homolog isoform X2 [Ostrea edulis]
MTSKTYKTYSKYSSKDSAASRAFDDVLNNKSAPPVPIKAEKTKWGDTSFTRVRKDDPFQVTFNKVKVENETVDEFSFDLEEDESLKKKVPSNNSSVPSASTGLGRPAIANVSKNPKKQGHPEPPSNLPKLENEDSDSINNDDDMEPVMFKRPVRTYSRSVKKEKAPEELPEQVQEEESCEGADAQEEAEDSSVPFSQKTDVFSDKNDEEGNSSYLKSRNKSQKITSRTHILQSEDEESSGATVLNFRSRYMDPAVYGNFEYTPHGDDPVGRMNNSKVLQQSEIKHGKGSTLIVICSPKPPAQGSSKLHPVRTYKVRDPNEKVSDDGEEKSEKELYQAIPAKPIIIRNRRRPLKRKAEDTPKASVPPIETLINLKQEPKYTPAPLKDSNKTKDGKPRKNKIFKSRNKVEIEEEEEEEKETSVTIEDTDTSEEAPLLQQEEVEDTLAFQEESVSTEDKDNAFGFGEMDVDETPESTQEILDTETFEEIPVKLKRVDELQQEDNGDSQSSEGELENSQDLPSSQESTDEFKQPNKERKIFKSKNTRVVQKRVSPSPKKSPGKAKYNMRSWQEDFDEEERNKQNPGGENGPQPGPPKLTRFSTWPKSGPEDRKLPEEPPKLTRAVHWPDRDGDEAYTSVHINKEHKQLYTVVRNVKEAHECQEHGETQEFADDVEYLLSGIQEGEPMSTRCLSCIGLAQKSILPAFRMHLRAHGTVAKIFGHLKDAVSDPSLSLCTALLMFMLSRDRLNMDLDRQSLDLMLKLLAVDYQEEHSVTLMGKRTLNRNKDRAREVYEQWKAEGGGTNQPEIEDVSTGNLAMESLLSLTSRRAGEWFKEELRTLGALDHIVDTVCSCIEALGDDTTLVTDSMVENMKKIDRCLRVLENVSFVNTDNQLYLISYKAGILVASLCRALNLCEKYFPVYRINNSDDIDKESTGYIIYSLVLAVLRVLINITHENEFGCTKVGDQADFIKTALICILDTPHYVPVDMRFDMLVLSLGLLINMVEHCGVNKRKLIEAETCRSYEVTSENLASQIPATKALCEVFCTRFEIAKNMEEQDFGEPTTPQASPNKSGEWKESDSGIEWVMSSATKDKDGKADASGMEEPENDKIDNLDDEETFTKALHRAGKHMENSVIASYVALLLGCLIQDNSIYVSQVKGHLKSGSFEDLITILKKFLGFMNLTRAIGSTGGKSIAHVIEVLEAC